MAEQARITSVQAIADFRASLITYLDRAKASVDEIHDEVLRTRVWLQTDRLNWWQMEHRRRQRKLEEAEAELFTARMGSLGEATAAQQMAVRRAREAVQDAEQHLSLIKQWTRDYDSRVEPLARNTDKLRDVLAVDMERAVQFLNGALDSLDAYARTALASAPEAPPPSPQTEP